LQCGLGNSAVFLAEAHDRDEQRDLRNACAQETSSPTDEAPLGYSHFLSGLN
jgi:hypothetical protein